MKFRVEVICQFFIMGSLSGLSALLFTLKTLEYPALLLKVTGLSAKNNSGKLLNID